MTCICSVSTALQRVFFFLILSGCTAPLVGALAQQELVLNTQQTSLYTTLDNQFAKPFYAEKVSFDSDVYFEPAEFYYLTDLRDGMLISAADLKKAVNYLIKKKKFETITLRLEQGTTGKRLHVGLKGFVTFGALKFHGMMLGKEAYRQYYQLEAGDPFDEVKHKRSLQAIAERFAQDGYHANSIETSLETNAATKSVVVHLTFKQKKRFAVGDVTVALTGEQLCPDDEYSLRHDLWRAFFKKIARGAYSKKMLNTQMQLLKRYLAKRGFLQVTIELKEQIDYAAHTVDLSFSCDVHKKKQLHFEGNSFLTTDQLLDELLLFGQSAWMLPSTMMRQEIEQAYRKKGFWDVEIDVSEQGDTYYFSIREGARASVKQVELKRVVSYKVPDLIKQHFVHVIKDKNFHEDLVERSVESCVSWYVAQGFLDAKALKQEYVPLDNPHVYKCVVTLDEGPRCFIRSIKFDHFQELQDQGPFLLIKQSKELQPFVMEKIQEQRQWLLDSLKKMGYPRARVQPEFSREGTNIDLHWKINAGDARTVFGKTVIVGSSQFPFAYVMRELKYTEGDPWDQDLLKKTMLRLKGLDVFDTLHLYPYDSANRHDDEQPLLLKMQQDDTYEARLRAGLAVQQVTKELKNAGLTYRVGGSFLIKNPLNCADQLRFETDVARSERTLTIQYRRPWLFNMPLRTTVQGYSNKYLYPGLFGGKKNLYEVDQQGFIVGFLRKYEHIDAEVNCGIELMRTAIGKDIVSSQMFANQLARAINFEPHLLNQKVPYVLIEPTLLADFVDNKLKPRSGSFSLLSLKGMFPFGNVGDNSYFVRLTAEQSFFVPLRNIVGAVRLRFGHIFRRILRSIMPPERFYLGGANSVRSYENDRCPPLGVFVDECGRSQLVPQGGKSMANLNLEIRFPIFKSVGGVLFQDFGALSGDNVLNEIRSRSVLAASGFGVRYDTPIGPLRFDIAWKWSRVTPEESRYAWFLTFGNAF